MAFASDFKGSLGYLIDILDIGLTFVGLAPEGTLMGAEIAADAATIVLNLLNDDPMAVILSILSLVPLAGQLSGALKIIYKVVKVVDMFMRSEILKIITSVIILSLLAALYYFIYFDI